MGIELNLDDGYIIRVHPVYGMEVYMRQDQPGVYYNGHGDEVAVTLAKEAGFATERLAQEKERLGKIGEAAAAINKMYAEAGEEKQVMERRGYTLVNIGFERYVVRDPNGLPVNANPVSSLKAAQQLFDQLVQPSKAEAPTKAE